MALSDNANYATCINGLWVMPNVQWVLRKPANNTKLLFAYLALSDNAKYATCKNGIVINAKYASQLIFEIFEIFVLCNCNIYIICFTYKICNIFTLYLQYLQVLYSITALFAIFVLCNWNIYNICTLQLYYLQILYYVTWILAIFVLFNCNIFNISIYITIYKKCTL